MKYNIIYSKIKGLEDKEKFALERVIENQFPKIKRMIAGDCTLKVKIKTSKKVRGANIKDKIFIIKYILQTQGKKFTTKSKDTKEAADYDITKAAHKEMNHLFNYIKHTYKPQDKNKKKFSLKKFLIEE